jgi:hypothetical protein
MFKSILLETSIQHIVPALGKATIDPRRHATATLKQTTATPGATALPLSSSTSTCYGNNVPLAWPPAKDPNLRDYKVIYDPYISGGRRAGDNGKEFLYRYNGEVAPGEEPIRVRDPRKNLSERNREGRGRARLRVTYYLLEYEVCAISSIRCAKLPQLALYSTMRTRVGHHRPLLLGAYAYQD